MIQTPTNALSGDLHFLTLADLLQLFGGNGATGILRVRSPHTAEIGVVYFQEGNPIEALAGDESGLDALFSLFGWIDGSFDFRMEKVTTAKAIRKRSMEIILDGLRMLDDNEIPKLGGDGGGSADGKGEAEKGGGATAIRGPLVDYMYVVDEETIDKGQEITVEGKHGGWIWVVLEGAVEIRKLDQGEVIPILRLGDGSFVGSVQNLTMGGQKRSATAVAASRVQLGVLDSQRMNTDFTKFSDSLRKVMLSADSRLRQITGQVVDFRAGRYDPNVFLKGKKPVIKQGDGENRLFQITQGEAAVVRNTPKGNIPLARLESGDIFGPIPFLGLGHEPDSASVFGSADLKVSRIEMDDLQGEYNALPTTWKNFLTNLATCIAATTQKACSVFPVGSKNPEKKS